MRAMRTGSSSRLIGPDGLRYGAISAAAKALGLDPSIVVGAITRGELVSDVNGNLSVPALHRALVPHREAHTVPTEKEPE